MCLAFLLISNFIKLRYFQDNLSLSLSFFSCEVCCFTANSWSSLPVRSKDLPKSSNARKVVGSLSSPDAILLTSQLPKIKKEQTSFQVAMFFKKSPMRKWHGHQKWPTVVLVLHSLSYLNVFPVQLERPTGTVAKNTTAFILLARSPKMSPTTPTVQTCRGVTISDSIYAETHQCFLAKSILELKTREKQENCRDFKSTSQEVHK